MVADNGWIWGARGERSEPSMGPPPAACCYLMVAVMVDMLLMVAVCGCMWLYVAVCGCMWL